jgi:GNAT superfamily N-acetyltransferase
MITIREMNSSEVNRISEIDRTEHITKYYKRKGETIEVIDIEFRVPPWNSREKIKEWFPIAENYQNMWGAFDRGKLVGFSVYRSQLDDGMAQFAILHVSRDFRGKGIGRELSKKVIDKARSEGKRRIYLTASPTKSTVDFYLKLGFELAEQLNEELYKLEPNDIHMILELNF